MVKDHNNNRSCKFMTQTESKNTYANIHADQFHALWRTFDVLYCNRASWRDITTLAIYHLKYLPVSQLLMTLADKCQMAC